MHRSVDVEIYPYIGVVKIVQRSKNIKARANCYINIDRGRYESKVAKYLVRVKLYHGGLQAFPVTIMRLECHQYVFLIELYLIYPSAD